MRHKVSSIGLVPVEARFSGTGTFAPPRQAGRGPVLCDRHVSGYDPSTTPTSGAGCSRIAHGHNNRAQIRSTFRAATVRVAKSLGELPHVARLPDLWYQSATTPSPGIRTLPVRRSDCGPAHYAIGSNGLR